MTRWKAMLTANGRAAGLVAVVAVWLLAFQIWWIAPRRAELVDHEAALARKRTEVTRLRQEAGRLAATEAGVADLEANLAGAPAARADGRDTAGLLRRVELLAADATLSMRGYTPEPAVAHDLHSEWPSRLELTGSYRELLLFLDRIQGCAGEVAIGDLAIRATDTADAGATVSAAFTLTAFAFNGAGGESAGRLPAAGCRPAVGTTDAAMDEPDEYADPFARLAPAADPLSLATRIPGLPGLRVGELRLQGLVISAGQPLAVVEAPGGETYILRGGERLQDGSVVAVNADAVVFLERGRGSGPAKATRRTLADPLNGR